MGADDGIWILFYDWQSISPAYISHIDVLNRAKRSVSPCNTLRYTPFLLDPSEMKGKRLTEYSEKQSDAFCVTGDSLFISGAIERDVSDMCADVTDLAYQIRTENRLLCAVCR